MKMSEFTTKSFLGNAGAAENSYILINYEDNSTSKPVTYKASLQEIGKAIANDQQLYKKTQDGVITTATNQGTYADITEGLLVTSAEKTKISEAVTRGQLLDSYGLFASLRAGLASTSDLSGLASTGYVTSAITTATSGLASTGDLAAKASTGAVAAAVSGLASTGYVTAAVANAGGNAGGNNGFTNDGDIPVYVGASDGDLKWYNWADPDNCTPYNVISTNGKYLVAYDENENTFGYFAGVSDEYMTPLSLGDQTDLHGYVQAASSLPGQYRLQFWEEGGQSPVEVTPSMVGAPSTGALTAAVSGLASTGYVTSAINAAIDSLPSTGDADDDKVMVSNDKLCYYNAEGSIDAVTIDMISGAAAPSTMEYNGTTLSYLLVEGSTDTYFKDDNGAWGNLGAVPVFYNVGHDQLIDIANNPINVGNNPYTVEVSEWTLNYMTFDNGGGQAIISGDGNNYEDLGHPLFFNETENEIGYYKSEDGERVWQTGSTVPQNTVFYSTDVSGNIFLEDGSGNTLIVFRYSQANNTYTLEAPNN